jgi:hypothetical protein
VIQHQQPNSSPDFHQIWYRGPLENVADHASVSQKLVLWRHISFKSIFYSIFYIYQPISIISGEEKDLKKKKKRERERERIRRKKKLIA